MLARVSAAVSGGFVARFATFSAVTFAAAASAALWKPGNDEALPAVGVCPAFCRMKLLSPLRFTLAAMRACVRGSNDEMEVGEGGATDGG